MCDQFVQAVRTLTHQVWEARAEEARFFSPASPTFTMSAPNFTSSRLFVTLLLPMLVLNLAVLVLPIIFYQSTASV